MKTSRVGRCWRSVREVEKIRTVLLVLRSVTGGDRKLGRWFLVQGVGYGYWGEVGLESQGREGGRVDV